MTRGSPASSLVALGAALVLLVALIWSALGTNGQPGADGAEPQLGTNGQPVADGAEPKQSPVGRDGRSPVFGPAPTVRWETPPKFGGRGGDYSVASARFRFRPGPYR